MIAGQAVGKGRVEKVAVLNLGTVSFNWQVLLET